MPGGAAERVWVLQDMKDYLLAIVDRYDEEERKRRKVPQYKRMPKRRVRGPGAHVICESGYESSSGSA